MIPLPRMRRLRDLYLHGTDAEQRLARQLVLISRERPWTHTGEGDDVRAWRVADDRWTGTVEYFRHRRNDPQSVEDAEVAAVHWLQRDVLDDIADRIAAGSKLWKGETPPAQALAAPAETPPQPEVLTDAAVDGKTRADVSR